MFVFVSFETAIIVSDVKNVILTRFPTHFPVKIQFLSEDNWKNIQLN